MNIINSILRLFLTICFLVPVSSHAGDWTYEIEPYLMFSTISGNSSVGRITGVPLDVSFKDILENLKIGGMAHFEAHHDSGWGISLDYGFMKLGAEITGTRGGITDVSVRQGVFEALAIKRHNLTNGHLDLLVGIRWWDNDLAVTIDPAILPGELSTTVKEDWIDIVVGTRFTNNFNDKWKTLLRADIGGLGIQSDFTLNLAAGIQYQMSNH